MARGWESKSVEAQIESAEAEGRPVPRERLSAAQAELLRKREGLLLSRTRVQRELRTSRNPRYQSILKKALADLDARLSQLG